MATCARFRAFAIHRNGIVLPFIIPEPHLFRLQLVRLSVALCSPISKFFAGDTPQFVYQFSSSIVYTAGTATALPHTIVASNLRYRSCSPTACAEAPAPTRSPECDGLVTFHWFALPLPRGNLHEEVLCAPLLTWVDLITITIFLARLTSHVTIQVPPSNPL